MGDMCECVAAQGLCSETCQAYPDQLADNQACMSAFVDTLCVEGAEGTLFNTPYYILCPEHCPLDCSFGPGSNDQDTIECLQKRVDVLEFNYDETSDQCEQGVESARGTCTAVLTSVE